jgi:hypothetical protein
MKLNDLISHFEIQTTNEETELLDKIQDVMIPEQFTEREQTVIENLIRKSLITKIVENDKVYLVKNGRKPF